REYIDLYTNFKLKVQAAQELRLDTNEQIKKEIADFRSQVEQNYMSDDKGRELLINEALQRSLKELHIVHFTVPAPPNTLAADTLKAYEAIHKVYAELKKGNKDYENIVGSTSPSLVKFNDVGFVTAFSLPYQFENVIYKLQPGEISKPYRTTNAWHIFKIEGERKSTGTWKVAQILLSISPSATAQEKAQVKKVADSVYALLLNGAEFGVATKKYSEDKLTYLTGGELPEFTTGRYEYVFEKEVMQLKADGEITKPFLTSLGYHIVKRLGHTPASNDINDPALQFDIKQKVLKDDRLETSRIKFSRDIMGKISLKKTNDVKDLDLFRYADSILINPFANPSAYPISKKPVLKINTVTLKGEDWLKFVADYKRNFNEHYNGSKKELWEKYLAFASNAYYKDHMEDYNADFRYQMKEFKEGNMLFEIMERNVWGMANSDTIGLLKHYEANKKNYTWPASAEAIIFNTVDESAAKDAMAKLNNGKNWKEVIDAINFSVQADSGRYELSQLIVNNAPAPRPGTFSSIVKNPDGTAVFIKYLGFYPPGGQRSFAEARGLVINDYQNVLEAKWLAQLKRKYPVKINEEAVQKLVTKQKP
ncbi:MAG: peptidylprolyl isomerase, partial [Ferruginibacter sp.]